MADTERTGPPLSGSLLEGALAKARALRGAVPQDAAQPASVPKAVVTPQPNPDVKDFVDLGQAVPRTRGIKSERASFLDPFPAYPERFSDELPPIMLKVHELIPLLKNAGLADKTPGELAVIANKLHVDLAVHIVNRQYELEQRIIRQTEAMVREKLAEEHREADQARFEEDEAIERMNQWVDLMIEFPRRYPEDFPDPNNLNTDAFFKRLFELQQRAGVDPEEMIRNEDDLIAAVGANIGIMRTALTKAFLVSFNRSGFEWADVREENRET